MKNQIRAWRKHRGLTQEQLAEAAATSPETISRLETGARRVSDVWIARLTTALDCTPTQLLSVPPKDGIQPDNEVPDQGDLMAIEQILPRLIRDLAVQQQQQTQVLAQLTQVLERLERILTLPETTRARAAR